jgi:Nucleotide modification associated domain 2
MPPTLFSYVVRDDAGSAPNPYWGVCTLVICKPRIRRAAQVGDWVVGTGSARSPIGNIKERVVYVMRVTDKMTLREYDAWAQEYGPEKVLGFLG